MRRAAAAAVAAAALAVVPSAGAAPVKLSVGTFAKPVFVTAPPLDTERVMVVEQAGLVELLRGGARQGAPFLDLRGLVDDGSEERGLLSIAFAPDYATSRKLYAYYTAKDPAGAIRIDELTADPSGDHVDPATRRSVLTIPHSRTNHNGGQLQIGPDGLLWLGTGDGGGAGDPDGNGQDRSTLLGKLLRIDPRPGDGCGGGCTIPADNPYASGGGAPEVWAYGLRNPWRFSFDRQAHDLWIGDVGQNCYEEIDRAQAPGLARGGNFEWNALEGDHAYDPSCGAAVAPGEHIGIPPLVEHAHNGEDWYSITGGYVVRDPLLPSLAGRYVFGDFAKGDLMSVAVAGTPDERPTGLHVDQLSSFGEDGCGRVYAASLGGEVFRLAEENGGGCAGPSKPAFDVPAGSPVPPGPGPGGGPAPDTTAPILRLRAARRLRLGAALKVSARCDEICRVVASARFSIRRPGRGNAAVVLRTGTARVTLAERARVTLRLRVWRATRAALARALRRHRRVTVRVTVVATDRAGNRRSARASVRLVRR